MSRNFPDFDMLASATRSETVLPAFSFAFWFNMNSPLGGPGNLFGYPLFTDESFFLLFYNTDYGDPGFNGVAELLWTDSTGATRFTDVFDLPVEGNWFHFAGTLDYTGDKTFHLYINGVEATNFRVPPDAGSGIGIDFTPTLGNPYPIGWCFGSDEVDSYALDGFIEDARLWSVGLTASEVLQVSQGSNVQYNNLIGWWKFCGESNPEPDSSANNNPMILSSNVPLVGSHATVNICAASSATATQDTIGVGEYGGNSLAEAFFNPHHQDILQVVNEGGRIVWNLAYDGTTSVNPNAPTSKALLGRYEGESFVLAFPNPYQKDILQIIGQGDNVVFWVDSSGSSH